MHSEIDFKHKRFYDNQKVSAKTDLLISTRMLNTIPVSPALKTVTGRCSLYSRYPAS